MKIIQIVSEQLLDERATDIVYHYTSIHNAYKILSSGQFLLANTSGTDTESVYAPKGYPYFLSTSRSKVGDYHKHVGASSGGVMFVLDGQWLSARYPVTPIDYWYAGKTPKKLKKGEWKTLEPSAKRSMWQYSPDRSRETEDRVFSKKNSIPLDGVIEIHLLLKEQVDNRSRWARRILIYAKQRNIPIFLYTSENAWKTQDVNKSVKPSEIKDILASNEKERYYFDRPVRGVGASEYGRSGILNCIELIQKKPGQPLSKSADKLRYNLLYYTDTYKTLENDIHNARKPGSNEYELGVKLTDYLRKNNLTVKSLFDVLKKKWQSKVNENTQGDMFPGEFATKRTTVPKTQQVSSKGAMETIRQPNINSAGRIISPVKQSLQNFWNWFGDSTAVDAKGRPLVFFHGTNSDFNEFKSQIKTYNSYGLLGIVETTRAAIFITPDKTFAHGYVRDEMTGANIISVYAKVSNPFDLRKGLSEYQWQELQDAGYNPKFIHQALDIWEIFDGDEGIHFVNTLKKLGYDGVLISEEGTHGYADVWAIFSPSQLKAVYGNRGTYDKSDAMTKE